MGPLIFLGIFFLLLNFFGIPFFRSLFTTLVILSVWSYLINGQIYLLAIFLFCALSAMAIWGDANELKVRFKFWFSALAFFFPLIGIPVYILFRKKLSQKLGQSISDNATKIQFFK